MISILLGVISLAKKLDSNLPASIFLSKLVIFSMFKSPFKLTPDLSAEGNDFDNKRDISPQNAEQFDLEVRRKISLHALRRMRPFPFVEDII